LKDHRRNELEQLLDIFAQENRTKNQHILNVKEEDFPEEYRSIISRLLMAAESEQVQGEMELEDDIIKELQEKDRRVAEQAKENEKLKISLEEKEKTIEEKEKTIEEKERAIEKNKEVIEEKEKENANLKKYLEEQAKEIEALKKKMTNNR
jgi:predicted RNase H-like nuclease (RuvC/YqgF family)